MPEAHAATNPDATRWRLDGAKSSVSFSVPHFWGLVSVKGHFMRLDGWLEAGEGRLELVVDAASLSTGNPWRDRHLRSVDFFDAQRHPEIRFRASAVRDAGDGRLQVEGDLSVAGEHVGLVLEPTVKRDGASMAVDVSATVDQRLLGMTWSPLGMTKSPTTVAVHALLHPEPRLD